MFVYGSVDMENKNSLLANRVGSASQMKQQTGLDQLLALRLELESKRRQETELKVRDSERLLDKMSRMSREQESREKLILDLRRRIKDEASYHGDSQPDASGAHGASQLAVAERTVKLLERDLSEMQKSYTGVKQELLLVQQELLDKRIELNRVAQANHELDMKVGKLERKVKDCWAEEDRLLDELHTAGDRIAGLEQHELESGLESFNRIAILEESLRLLGVLGICREIVLETVVDALDLACVRASCTNTASVSGESISSTARGREFIRSIK